MWTILIAGLGVALALEGAAYALAPVKMQDFLRQISQLSPDQLRLAGLFALSAGVLIAWLVLSG